MEIKKYGLLNNWNRLKNSLITGRKRMRKKTKKHLVRLLAVAMVLSGLPVQQTQAAETAGLSSRKITLTVGKSKTITLKNNKKKTVWKLLSGKKCIRIRNMNKNSVKIAAVKAGQAKIQVKAGKKKYKCSVIVKDRRKDTNVVSTTSKPETIQTSKPSSSQISTPLPVQTKVPETVGTDEPSPSQPVESIAPTGIPTPVPTAAIEPNYHIGEEKEIALTKENESETVNVEYTVIPEETGLYDMGWLCEKGSYRIEWKFTDSGKYYTTSSTNDCRAGSDDKGWGDNWCILKNFEMYKNQVYTINLEFSNINEADKAGFKIKKSDTEIVEAVEGQQYEKPYSSTGIKTSYYYFIVPKKGYYRFNCTYTEERNSLYMICYTERRNYLFNVMPDSKVLQENSKKNNTIYLQKGQEVLIEITGTMWCCFDYAGPVDSTQWNAHDVDAITKIIQEQKAVGAEISDDLQSEEYEWSSSGRLIGIYWFSKRVSGKLDFSSLSELQSVECGGNNITEINVSNNLELKKLGCSYNRLTSIDMSKNINLKELQCHENKLSKLDLKGNLQLETVYCGNNQISDLDISRNTKLTFLSCEGNQLNTLDVSNNTLLSTIRCQNNQLEELDVSNCSDLTQLTCYGNKITMLDLSKNKSLFRIDADENVNIIYAEN